MSSPQSIGLATCLFIRVACQECSDHRICHRDLTSPMIIIMGFSSLSFGVVVIVVIMHPNHHWRLNHLQTVIIIPPLKFMAITISSRHRVFIHPALHRRMDFHYHRRRYCFGYPDRCCYQVTIIHKCCSSFLSCSFLFFIYVQ